MTRNTIRDRSMTDRDDLARWLASEDLEDDTAADAAFSRVFAVLPAIEPSEGFADRTVAAAWRMRSRQRRIAALGWAAVVLIAVAGAGAGAIAAVPASAWAIKAGAHVLLHAAPWLAAYGTEAMNVWWIVARIGSEVAAAVATPSRAAAVVGVELVAISAFFALQRLVQVQRPGEAHV